MKKNMGLIDKIVRFALAVLAYGLYFAGVTSGAVAIITVLLGTVFGLTALANFCPLYSIFKIKTCSPTTKFTN